MAKDRSFSAKAVWVGLFPIVLFSSFLLPIFESHATDEHYINIIVGERPAGLGGAYTAISNDTAGLFYNPAGIVYSEGQNLSVSVNSFYSSSKKYENAIGTNAWTRSSSSIVPNYFGLSKPFGPGVVGFSYAVPDTVIEDQDETFTNLFDAYGITEYRINFNKEDTTINAGPSYAMELGNGLSVGLTLYYHNRVKQQIQNEFTWYGSDVFSWENEYQQTDEYGIRPLLGIMFAPLEKPFTIGFSISNTILMSSSTSFHVRSTSTGVNASDYPMELSVKRDFPINPKLGFSYKLSEDSFITMDISYFTATPSVKEVVAVAGTTALIELQEEKKAITNYAVGAEFLLVESIKARVGFFTDMSPAFDVGERGSDEKIDVYGASVCISQLSENSSVDLGISYGFGSGSAKKNERGTIENATTQSMLFFLGTSHAY